jgi:hypothetical protein
MLVSYEKCMNAIKEHTNFNIQHFTSKLDVKGWQPLGGIIDNKIHGDFLFFYTWNKKVLKMMEINMFSGSFLEYRYFKDTVYSLMKFCKRTDTYRQYLLNIVDVLNLSRYTTENIFKTKIIKNYLEINCNYFLNWNKTKPSYPSLKFNSETPIYILSYAMVGPDTYVQWIDRIETKEDIERNLYLTDYFPNLKRYINQYSKVLECHQ